MWSKLQNQYPYSKLFEYLRNSLKYHNINHILDMYKYLEYKNVPYSPELDIAILFHDIVYDHLPHKEQRSIVFFETFIKAHNISIDEDQAKLIASLIEITESHELNEFSSDLECWMVLADLSGFEKTVTTLRNYILVMDESILLYNCSEIEFAKANLNFLSNLLKRTSKNNEFFPGKFDNINCGIELAIGFSNSIIKET